MLSLVCSVNMNASLQKKIQKRVAIRRKNLDTKSSFFEARFEIEIEEKKIIFSEYEDLKKKKHILMAT